MPNQRLINFHSYKDHAWLKKVYVRLKKDDIDCAEQFIVLHDHLDKGDFELAINRMFLDKPKPKNFREILELLTCANSKL